MHLALKSAWNRRMTLALVIIAIALSTTLLLTIERLRHDVRTGFAQSISGTDLIVGARSSSVNLLLYSIFRIGGITHNIGWDSAKDIADNPLVAWTIPISLGDSHRGFPVLATNQDYFRHYRYGNKKSLVLQEGKSFNALFDAVIGAEVARKLQYHVGDHITLTHGMHTTPGSGHDDKPFIVTGILQPTGTAVDRTIHISLEAMEAIHLDWQGGSRLPGFHIPPDQAKKFDLTPKSITALLVGLHHRTSVFTLQREINTYPHEALMGILPGVALDELWQIVGIGENVLRIISAMVVIVGLAGLVSSILSALGERRRELAILRSVGARPRDIFLLLAIEGCSIMSIGVVLGILLQFIATLALGPLASTQFGIRIDPAWPSAGEWLLAGWIMLAGMTACLLPALRAYQLNLSDGLTPRI